MELSASSMLGKHSTTNLHPQPGHHLFEQKKYSHQEAVHRGGYHKATSRKAVHIAHSTDNSHRSQLNFDSRSRQLTCEDATETRVEQNQKKLSVYQHAKEKASSTKQLTFKT